VDVTPPIGAPLCYGLVVPAERVEAPLLAKGIVLRPERAKPIVLCAVDWLGIGGASHVAWREKLAEAAGTTRERVAVHTVHQHDAPGDYADALAFLDNSRAEILAPQRFCVEAMTRVALGVVEARAVPVTHWAMGEAKVEKVASNRRILSADGKTFAFQRFTACRNSPQCDAPEGVIDPMLRTLSFYDGERRVASLHYYATHPMSYYGKGMVGPDFVGMARERLEGFHVYFTGAAGNVGAGKYNDGSIEKRAVLAARMEAAMRAALEGEKRRKIGRVDWRVAGVRLPHRDGEAYNESTARSMLGSGKTAERASAARYLAWWEFVKRGGVIDLQTLRLDGASVVHMPGELFVEYQLAASAMRKGERVAMAAYGDYGPMYIGTRKAYAEGGYETSAVSRVSPESEDILLGACKRMLT
jgi:hypothetical protein